MIADTAGFILSMVFFEYPRFGIEFCGFVKACGSVKAESLKFFFPFFPDFLEKNEQNLGTS